MKKDFKLTIPTPCSESWHLMTPKNDGRFCQHCQKTVVDFTQMTDNEIAFFFANNKEKVCGHFRKSQINKNYTYIKTEQNHSPMVKYVLAFLAVATFSANTEAFAQGKPIEKPKSNTTQSDNQSQNESTQPEKIIISGYLRYEKTGKIAPNEKVMLVDFREEQYVFETKTNELGFYSFELDKTINATWWELQVDLYDKTVYDDTRKPQLDSYYDLDLKRFPYNKISQQIDLWIKEERYSEIMLDGDVWIED